MVDPDDVEAIALVAALDELVKQSKRLADPEQGLWAFFDMVVAVMLHQQLPGRPLSWIMLLCARRVTSDIAASL